MTFLHLRDLAVTIGPTVILEGINLDVPAGARHAIIGHNGAGKSTLLNAVAGQVNVTRGRILLAGNDITGLPPHRRARAGIARTWQHPTLAGQLTVADNLRLALRHGRRTDHDELLIRFGLSPVQHRRVDELPYGMQRKTELMIALAARPRLLLLDEPSAGLGPTEVAAVMRILTGLEQETTVLLTDHHPDVITSVATSSTYLTRGRITDPPPPADGPTPQDRAPSAATGEPALRVAALTAGYGRALVLRDITFTVHPGQTVAVVADNGAGKSTLLNTIAGIGPAHTTGSIHLGPHALTGLPAARRQQLGLGLLPQQRRIFARLTVGENLQLPHHRDIGVGPPELLFDQLRGRQRQRAGTLSGGEQQLLAIARAVAAGPSVLLLDEPFEGLARTAAARLRQLLAQLNRAGTAIVIADHRLDDIGPIIDEVHVLADGQLRDGP
ncbi:ATP-binding cassette domain-containing protein [Allorhizocola rhizosphaerae]|uniref:ATP-binding cassette domain-containing protein n=1 Tax=Allorhizocola rhizosphaerae TaxID=1872709 RepID=UPI0013C2A2B1|nr:ATP-binding cassette domain-containing protein [Allorhizocola rhizosphaerae]